jgi:hypothetical protein
VRKIFQNRAARAKQRAFMLQVLFLAGNNGCRMFWFQKRLAENSARLF